MTSHSSNHDNERQVVFRFHKALVEYPARLVTVSAIQDLNIDYFISESRATE